MDRRGARRCPVVSMIAHAQLDQLRQQGRGVGMLPTNTSDLHTPAYLQARKTAFRRKKARFGVSMRPGRLSDG